MQQIFKKSIWFPDYVHEVINKNYFSMDFKVLLRCPDWDPQVCRHLTAVVFVHFSSRYENKMNNAENCDY